MKYLLTHYLIAELINKVPVIVDETFYTPAEIETAMGVYQKENAEAQVFAISVERYVE